MTSNPVQAGRKRTARPHDAPQNRSADWLILRVLASYRLVLVCLLISLGESGLVPAFFRNINFPLFRADCYGYALGAVLLLLPTFKQRPRLTRQIPAHFVVDAAAVTVLVYACNGVSSGMGALLITPIVGYSLILFARAAFFNAAVGTLLMFGAEAARYAQSGFGASNMAAVGILGVIFFGTTTAGTAVAYRARRGEASAKKANDELADLLDLNKRIVEHMEIGVLTVEANGVIRLVNGAARRLLNVGHVEGSRLDAAVPWLGQLLAGWQPHRMTSAEAHDGVIPRFMPLGSQSQTLVLLDDAARLGERVQQMKLAALGRLTASIAHEIRNPLSAIGHAGQLLAESDGLAAEDRRLVDMIGRQSTRIDKIVEDVLSLSRRSQEPPERITLRPWLQRTIGLYCEAHMDVARPIDLHGVEEGLVVRFNGNHLQQILENLWNNGFEHGGRDGRAITVRLTSGRLRDGSFPYLDIADDGPGVPPDLAQQIFEPFFTTGRSGTGLGLYLVRELCEYNRARIICRTSTLGACFRIIFTAT